MNWRIKSGQRDIRRGKSDPPIRYEAVEKCLGKVGFTWRFE